MKMRNFKRILKLKSMSNNQKNYLWNIDFRVKMLRALVYFSGITSQKIPMILRKLTKIRRDRLAIEVIQIRRVILAQLAIPWAKVNTKWICFY